MRTRASVAVVTGALALTALAVPAAQAADAPSAGALARSVAPTGKSTADVSYGDTKISNVVVNGGKSVILGTTLKKTFTVTFTVTDNSGVNTTDSALAILWHGSTFDKADNAFVPNQKYATCTKVNSTSVNCKQTYTVDPTWDLLNANAGTWKTWALGQGKDADYVQKDNVKSFYVKRNSKLTVDAAPEPVKKGGTLTVTGKLTRANWEDNKYHGYTAQPVKLQFRKKGSSTYTTLKTITTNSTGSLKTTVKATGSGYYRYSFAGTPTTPAVNATGDYVEVK
ncbi:calcium-binding protein [Streptomyces sp. NPDC001020]